MFRRIPLGGWAEPQGSTDILSIDDPGSALTPLAPVVRVVSVGIQRGLSDVMSEFAQALVRDFSIQATLDQLVLRVVDVLSVTGAGISLITDGNAPGYVAASNDDALRCERLQLSLGEGPLFEPSAPGDSGGAWDLSPTGPFPAFAAEVRAAGYGGVLSFPLFEGEDRLGVLDLYRATSDGFDPSATTAAKTLANVAAAYLLIAQARVHQRETSERARRSSLHDDESVRALRASEQRKTAILASALDAVVTIDSYGRVVEFNPAAERTFGCSQAEASGLELAAFVEPPHGYGPQWVEVDRYLASSDGSVRGRRLELVATRCDATTFPAEVSITAVDGIGPRFFTAFIRDLTEREALEAERRGLEARVQQAERLESLGQLAGGVAHDFNNLLTVILNFASFIAETDTNGAETRSQASEIVTSAERAARLTEQLLMFARREPVQRALIDINEVLAEIEGLLVSAVGERILIVMTTAPGVPAFTGDRGQTEQLLMNLAVNARDAMPDGGTLSLSTGVVEDDGESYVELTVTDSGQGMSEEVVAHAFEPFFTTKAIGEGTGLGLATVYGIVADAAGSVKLSSPEGHGTTVTVRFPVAGPAIEPIAAVDSLAPVSAGETILVVEDQAAVRSVIVSMLRRNGYRVLEAGSAKEALVIASSDEFDLLLTDVVMPGMSGRELAESLHDREPGHLVLYMSGYSAGVFGAQRALDRHETLIHKPFKERTLLEALHRLLGTRTPDLPRP